MANYADNTTPSAIWHVVLTSSSEKKLLGITLDSEL